MAKQKKITEMTWHQVRSRGGITKREFERRLKISKSLKQYYQRRKPKDKITSYYPTKERIRHQKVLNYRSSKSPYYISIRVMTINPDITERGLLMALNEIKLSLQKQSINIKDKARNVNIDFARMDSVRSSIGTEKTKIAPHEDTQLNDLRVHYEILIERNPAIIGTL
jgi:hypothetical protein